MSLQPKISVVIPTYNRGYIILNTIQSIIDQRFRNFEIIIVDDGSTDNTDEVITPILTEFIRYEKIKNSERGFARNYGARLAKGDYVNFFDSDDIALPNHLEEASKAIELLHEPEVFHLNYVWVRPDLTITQEARRFNATANDELIFGNTLSCNGVFIRRDIILKFPFNESRDLSASEDWDLWLKLASRFRMHTLPTVTSYIVNHDERSVNIFNEKKIQQRADALVNSLSNDKVFAEKYPDGTNKIKAHMNSYLALHAATKGYKLKPVRYLFRSLKSNIGELFTRRTLAIIKHLFITYSA